MLLIIRLLLFVLFIVIIYKILSFLFHPKRKLEFARNQGRFYFLDYENNIRKNFFITYKGIVFEGEKYLGTTDTSFDVINIFIWPHDISMLNGFTREDFYYLESKVYESYPNASIDWKSPINELLKQNNTVRSLFHKK